MTDPDRTGRQARCVLAGLVGLACAYTLHRAVVLRIEYYDGYDWYDSWGDAEGNGRKQSSLRDQPNLSGLPEAVRITLWCDPDSGSKTAASPENPPAGSPLVFQTVARLNLAGAWEGASSSGSSGSTASGNTGVITPGPGSGGRN